MPEQPLPLLTGRILLAERYVSVRGGSRRPSVTNRDVAVHSTMIEGQLLSVWRTVARREHDERDFAASREIIAIQPEPGSEVPTDSFGDSRYGMRVVAKDPDTGVILVDAARPDLPHVHQKIQAYRDDTKVSPTTGERRGAQALNPVKEIRVASVEDIVGPRLRSTIASGELRPDTLTWLELACRGGTRARTMETDSSRSQIARGLLKLNRQSPIEFLAPEQAIFFVRISLEDLRKLVRATDCVYDAELVSEATRDWLTFEHQDLPTPEFLDFELTPPPADAIVVTILDTGVASSHPMLAAALLAKHTVVPHDSSPEDSFGHGTMMAGVSLHEDVAAAVASNRAVATHWIESVKLLVAPNVGTALEDEAALWPVLTQRAIEAAEAASSRNRVFAMAVTARLDEPYRATSWSHAVDQFAYNEGKGRLICVAVGNCEDTLDPVFVEGYPHINLARKLDDPAHAVNALSVGAYTAKVELRPELTATHHALAPEGGVSPLTRSGIAGQAIKPDVVFEGGNLMSDGRYAYNSEPSLSTLTTAKDVLTMPLALHQATSAATAQAARFAARVWLARPELNPATIRGLIAHSANWTPQMKSQLPNLDERLRLCGYGVPDLSYATECLASRATVIVQDRMPNMIARPNEMGEEERSRVVKLARLPVPESLLLQAPDQEVELRVTLSFFGEPSTVKRQERMGLRLGWDMQGPAESESDFRARVNRELRPKNEADEYTTTSGFDLWVVGARRRARGTVQSDRLRVPASLLAGDKLLAVYPVLGWWDERNDTREESMDFSLIMTLEVPGKDIYTPISMELAQQVEIEVPG